MAADRFELRLLGPVEALVDGRPMALGGRRQRAVLARLALASGHVVGAEQLVDDLWDEPPPGARNTIQTYVARLRRLLPPSSVGMRIETAGGGYRLHLEKDEMDASRAERQIDESRATLRNGRAEGAVALLRAALATWRGEALADLPELPWVIGTRARMAELRATALEEIAAAELALGAPERAVAAIAELTGEEPLRERAWELLMEALYRSGRQADALEAFHRIRRRLAEELGVDPGPGLRAQEARILRHDPSLMGPVTRAGGGVAVSRAPRSGLPLQHTSFVGRARELERLAGHVVQSPLVTIVGVGGSGKTRLAIEVAGRLSADLADGAWFVGLEHTNDEAAVARLAAEALGIHEEVGRDLESTIADAIGERELLLLLDNCEHLLEAASRLAEMLLGRCPRIRILATSREQLAVPGERVFVLEPMAVPEEIDPELDDLLGTDAARLFVERAARAAPDFTPRPDHAADLARLLRRLDGLPLAVELAATRVRSLGLPQIVHQLEAADGELRATSRTSAERHRSLRATVDWSYRLLTRPERVMLARLSAFAGPFLADDAVAVCADATLPAHDVVDLLGSLVDRSLVARADPPGTADASFRLLDTIRRIAAEHLAEMSGAVAVHERHALHFAALAEVGGDGLTGSDQLTWLHRLTAASADLAAALGWLVARRRGEAACRLAASLRPFWEMRGHMREGLAWVQRALLVVDGSPDLARGAALVAGADLATGVGDHQLGEELARQACEVAMRTRDTALLADARYVHGLLGKYQGQYRRATLQLERARRLNRRAGRRWHVAQALHHLGMVRGYQGRYAEARDLHQESLALFRSLGDADAAGSALRSLGIIAIGEGEYERAEALAEEALVACERLESVMNMAHARYTLADVRRLRGELADADGLYAQSIEELRHGGDRRCVASTLRNRGLVALARSQLAAARAYLDESLELRTDLDDRAGIAESLEGLAEVAAREGDAGRAAELFGAAEAMRRTTGAARTPHEEAEIGLTERRLAASLGRAAFEAARTRGAATVEGASSPTRAGHAARPARRRRARRRRSASP